DDAREPFVVGRHHKPRRFRRAGVADHVLVGLLISRPQLALFDVIHEELPALARLVDSFQEAPALFLFRDVEKKFEDQRAVTREMPLEGADIVEPVFPDVPTDEPLADFALRAAPCGCALSGLL